MSGSSISPFGSGSFFEMLFKQRLPLLSKLVGRVWNRVRSRRSDGTAAPDSGLVRLASEAIREHAAKRATLFERAQRERERADRLESEGTPSDSARNRAERAEEEVREGLAALRSDFAGERGDEGARAFDRELSRQHPALELRS